MQVRRLASGGETYAVTRRLRLDWDLKTGLWEARWPAGGASAARMRGASCAVRLADGTELKAGDYPRHECGAADVVPVRDAFGAGTQVTVRHVGAPGKPELRQRFLLYQDLPYFLVRLEVVSPAPVATNHVAPIVVDDGSGGGGLHLGSGADDAPLRTLFVPYDNDAWVRYDSGAVAESYGVTAAFDNASRRGFVVGSVTHDLWKTGIAMGGHGPGRLERLRVYGGATSAQTRDSQPHGRVSGKVVASPLVFVGYFPDWRDGLEVFGRANGRLQPPLAWKEPGGVPFGWNSWAAHKEKVTQTDYLAASDFFRDTLQPRGFADARGDVYLNLDSYWDNLTEAQIVEAVRHVRANGQKAGIYWSPFVCWGGDLSRPVEGTDGRYSYDEILLRDSEGALLPELDGGRSIDPTHPGALLRTDEMLRRFVAWGFDFVKLDFLSHGAREGKHFDAKVPTGTAAYHIGMRRVLAALTPARVGRPFFISLSIAPLFPGGYGHSRRISCDAAGGVGATEYMLNSLTYGWWAQGGLYHYNDPDHTVLYQERGQRTVSEAEGRSRLNASVISGTVLLHGDDLTQEAARERAVALLTNAEVNALARAGVPFRPVEGDTGSKAADVFVRHDRASGRCYVALFNHHPSEARTGALDLARLGLDPGADYEARDLWAKRVTRVPRGKLPVDLPPADSTILCLSRV